LKLPPRPPRGFLPSSARGPSLRRLRSGVVMQRPRFALVVAIAASAGAASTLPRTTPRLVTPNFGHSPPAFSPTGGPGGGPPHRSPDFHANLGRCIDTLQAEYPTMLARKPTMDIFTDDVILVDVHSGLKLRGKGTYERALAVMRWAASLSLAHAECGALIVYDPIASQIRVRWHAKLFRNAGDSKPVHVDGRGLYSVNSDGLIYKHELRSDVPVGPSAAALQHPLLAMQGCSGLGSLTNLGHWVARDHVREQRLRVLSDDTCVDEGLVPMVLPVTSDEPGCTSPPLRSLLSAFSLPVRARFARGACSASQHTSLTYVHDAPVP